MAGETDESQDDDQPGCLDERPAPQKIPPQNQRDGEPEDGRCSEVRSQGKTRNACKATADVADIGDQAVWRVIEGPSHHLANADKDQCDQGEEKSGQQLNGNEELRQVLARVFRAEIYLLW